VIILHVHPFFPVSDPHFSCFHSLHPFETFRIDLNFSCFSVTFLIFNFFLLPYPFFFLSLTYRLPHCSNGPENTDYVMIQPETPNVRWCLEISRFLSYMQHVLLRLFIIMYNVFSLQISCLLLTWTCACVIVKTGLERTLSPKRISKYHLRHLRKFEKVRVRSLFYSIRRKFRCCNSSGFIQTVLSLMSFVLRT
jgi:hypothetical protein